MELGKLQKEWIKSLRENHERQTDCQLGIGNIKEYKACCLGELHICYHRINGLESPFKGGTLYDSLNDVDYDQLLDWSYYKYGLFTSDGHLTEPFIYEEVEYPTLATMNDSGFSWIEIADFIEKNPELVFAKSV